MKKIFALFLRFGISAALLVFLFNKIDAKEMLGVLVKVRPFYFILAVILSVLINIGALYRWRALLEAQGVKLPFMRILSSYSGGLFFSLFLPSTIGGDVAKSVDLGIHTKRKSVIAATVFLDRLSGFVGLVLIALCALILGYKFITEPAVYLVILFLAAILFGMLLIIFNKKLYFRINKPDKKYGKFKEVLKKLHAEIYFFRSKPFVLLQSIFYSILIQIGSFFTAYFTLRSLSINIRMIYPMVLNPVISIIATLPISIGGLGLRDGASVFFYAKAGVSKDAAFAQSLLSFALIVFCGLIGGVIYVSTLHYRRIQPDSSGKHSKEA